jgi:hypothetical protein
MLGYYMSRGTSLHFPSPFSFSQQPSFALIIHLDARSENTQTTTPKMLAQHLVAAFLGQSDHSEDEPITPKRESADGRNG